MRATLPRFPLPFVLAVAALAAACGGASLSSLDVPVDAGIDVAASSREAGKADAGKGKSDGSAHDAGHPDATVIDAPPDSAPADVTAVDAPLDAVSTPDAAGVDVVANPDGAEGDGGSQDGSGNAPDASGAKDASDDVHGGATPDTGVDAGSTCPATAPNNLSACTTVGAVCDFSTEQCTCANDKFWRCDTCPATAPVAGSACTSGALGGTTECSYGTEECSCTGGNWACGTCPAAPPTNDSACPAAGLDCAYAAATCRCATKLTLPPSNALEWQCAGSCPATQPSPGAACDVGAGTSCTYGTVTCVCNDGQFFCD